MDQAMSYRARNKQAWRFGEGNELVCTPSGLERHPVALEAHENSLVTCTCTITSTEAELEH
jgi:hypothetical protein